MHNVCKSRNTYARSTEALSPASLSSEGVPQSSRLPRAKRTPLATQLVPEKKTVQFFYLEKNRAVFLKILR